MACRSTIFVIRGVYHIAAVAQGMCLVWDLPQPAVRIFVSCSTLPFISDLALKRSGWIDGQEIVNFQWKLWLRCPLGDTSCAVTKLCKQMPNTEVFGRCRASLSAKADALAGPLEVRFAVKLHSAHFFCDYVHVSESVPQFSQGACRRIIPNSYFFCAKLGFFCPTCVASTLKLPFT